MKVILKTLCFIFMLHLNWAYCMNDDMYTVMQHGSGKLHISDTEDESSDSETTSPHDEGNYNILTESGHLTLCSIIRNKGCQEALNFLKDLSSEQIDINSTEIDGKNNALKETIKTYGLDNFTIHLLLELYERGARLDAEDEENLKKSDRGKFLLFLLKNPEKLKRLVVLEKEGVEYFKKMEKKTATTDKINPKEEKKEIIEGKNQRYSKTNLIKYITLGSICIASIYIFFKILKKKKY